MSDFQQRLTQWLELMDLEEALYQKIKAIYLHYESLAGPDTDSRGLPPPGLPPAGGAHTSLAREMSLIYKLYYLRQKLHSFWLEDNLQALVRKHRPLWEFFTPTDFEQLVQVLLYFVEGTAYELTKSSHDRGIDLICESRVGYESGFNGISRRVVQCKLVRRSVSVADIRDFFGVVTANVAEGYFFTTGTLSPAGADFIHSANLSPYANRLHFIGGEKFQHLLGLSFEIAEIWDDYWCSSDEEEASEILQEVKEPTLRALQILRAPLPQKGSSPGQMSLFEDMP
jgi:hypothetical protein